MNDETLIRKAEFQEALALNIEDETLDLMRDADRLSWSDGWSSTSLDLWIEATETALFHMKCARARAVRGGV